MPITIPPVPRIIVLLLAWFGLCAAWGHALVFTLKEVTGRAWGPSVVHYQVIFERPIADETTMLVDSHGAVLPYQLSDVTRNGGRICSATVSFLASLAPHETMVYTLRQHFRPPMTPTPVTVTQRRTEVEIANERLRVRLAPLTNRYYTPPIPAVEAPAPLRGFQLADGSWAGGSTWQSTRPVIS